MSFARPLRALLLLAVCATAAVTQERPAQAAQPAQPAQASRVPIAEDPQVLAATRLFTAWLEGQMLNKGTPGVAVGVVADQELVWARGFGHANVAARTPMTPQTKFRIASHSKLFTATAVMQLREEGKVRLDDAVSTHLSWFRMRPAGDDDGPITIEQLLTHSSGLQREAGDHWTTYNFPTSAELRALMDGRQAAFAPQTRWKYSNLAYSIAGDVVERVSGMPWAAYVERNIFQPLGMNNTSVDRDVPGMATGYGRRMPDGTRETFPFVDARGMAAATGMTSTVEDLAKFVSAQFRSGARGGNRILSSGSLREMHRVRSVEEHWTSGNAIGFSITRTDGRSYTGHGGGYPGYTTRTFFQLDDRVGVIVLTNSADSDVGVIAEQLMASVGKAVGERSKPKPAVVAWDPSWARFAGRYREEGGDSEVVLLHEELVLLSLGGNSLANRPLTPLGGGRFRLGGRTGGGEVGEVVRFEERDGKVVRMYTGDSFTERLP